MKQKPNKFLLQELFSQYCNWRLDQVSKNEKDFNYCVEEFAKTEMFQFKCVDAENGFDNKNLKIDEETAKIYVENYDNLSLPFERQFIKVAEIYGLTVCIFIGEFAPKIITGSVVMYDNDLRMINSVAFSIKENGELDVDFPNMDEMPEEFTETNMILTWGTISVTLDTLNSLGKHVVVKDTPECVVQYYRRKHASTIQVKDRPIYYVLDKKYKDSYRFVIKNPIGKLTYSHTFKVRGHWRVLNSMDTLGKNREGIRNVKGYTWVKEHLKGEGELKQKLRVVK